MKYSSSSSTPTLFFLLVAVVFCALYCCTFSTASIENVAFTGDWSLGNVVTLSFNPSTTIPSGSNLRFDLVNATDVPECANAAIDGVISALFNDNTRPWSNIDNSFNPYGSTTATLDKSCHIANGTAVNVELTPYNRCGFTIRFGGEVIPDHSIHCYFFMRGVVSTPLDYNVTHSHSGQIHSAFVLPALIPATNTAANAEWSNNTYTVGDGSGSRLELLSPNPPPLFPEHMPMKLVLSFTGANLRPYTQYGISQNFPMVIKSHTSAWCGRDVRALVLRNDLLLSDQFYLLTGANPANDFECTLVMTGTAAFYGDSTRTPQELVFSVAGGASHTLGTQLTLAIPPAFTAPTRPPRFHASFAGGSYPAGFSRYKRYYVATNGAPIVAQFKNVTGNLNSLEDIDAFYGVGRWSLSVACQPSQSNLVYVDLTSAAPMATFNLSNTAGPQPDLGYCAVQFKTTAGEDIPFQITVQLNGHDVILRCPRRLTQRGGLGSTYPLDVMTNSFVNWTIPLTLNIPTTWAAQNITAMDQLFPIEFTPDYPWVAEEPNLHCDVNITASGVDLNHNNTQGELVSFTPMAKPRSGVRALSYELFVSKDLPPDNTIDLLCSVAVNPKAKLPPDYLTAINVMLPAIGVTSSGYSYTGHLGTTVFDGWFNTTMRLQDELGKAFGLGVFIPEADLPATPAAFATQLAAIFNTPLNAPHIDLITAEHISVHPFGNADEQVNLPTADPFFSTAITFPTTSTSTQRAIDFNAGTARRITLVVRPPSVNSTGGTEGLPNWTNYFTKSIFQHDTMVLRTPGNVDYFFPTEDYPWSPVTAANPAYHFRQAGDACTYHAQCFGKGLCLQGVCHNAGSLEHVLASAAGDVELSAEQFFSRYEGWHPGHGPVDDGDDGNGDDETDNGGGDNGGGDNGGGDNGGGDNGGGDNGGGDNGGGDNGGGDNGGDNGGGDNGDDDTDNGGGDNGGGDNSGSNSAVTKSYSITFFIAVIAAAIFVMA